MLAANFLGGRKQTRIHRRNRPAGIAVLGFASRHVDVSGEDSKVGYMSTKRATAADKHLAPSALGGHPKTEPAGTERTRRCFLTMG